MVMDYIVLLLYTLEKKDRVYYVKSCGNFTPKWWLKEAAGFYGYSEKGKRARKERNVQFICSFI